MASDFNPVERVWRRAWHNAEGFRASWRFFWGAEVVGAALFAAYSSYRFLDSKSAKWELAFYPAIGVIVGMAAVFAAIYAVCFAVAPVKQRNDARGEADRLNACLSSERDANEEAVAEFLEEGRRLLGLVQAAWIAEHHDLVLKWQSNVFEFLKEHVPLQAQHFMADGFPNLERFREWPPGLQDSHAEAMAAE